MRPPHIPRLSRRSLRPERMDAADCDPVLLLRTIDQFTTINALLSRSRGLMLRTVFRDMQREPNRSYHLADLGAGGCDLAVWCLREAQKRGLSLQVTAIEGDARIAAHAQKVHGSEPGIRIVHGDALEPGCLRDVDYAFGNHFLHHLTDEEITALLEQCRLHVQRGVLFNDLHRSHASLAAFWLLTLVAWRNSFAREDGLRSIQRGFRLAELRDFCIRAGLTDAHCTRGVPGRVYLWSRTLNGVDAADG